MPPDINNKNNSMAKDLDDDEDQSNFIQITSTGDHAEDPLRIQDTISEENSISPQGARFMCKIEETSQAGSKPSRKIIQEKQPLQIIMDTSSSLSQTIVSILICIVCTAFSMEFSIRFPHFLSTAAQMTFSHAWYQYDPTKTFFDTTFLTYGTDYIIFIIMVYASYQCAFAGSKKRNASSQLSSTRDLSRPLRLRSAALLACYAISVLAGGYAHQFYITFEDLQTTSFRILWTVCVGSVTLAGGFMGMCGAEICRIFLHGAALSPSQEDGKNRHSCITWWNVPIIPDSWWMLYGLYMTLYCIAGGISCFRPAADIFLAGVTQFIPTLYCELIMLSRLWKDSDKWDPTTIPKSTRYIFYYGFILNAPLLPLYPYLIHHTTLTLGAVNALLHLNLTISWGMQAISLYQICTILQRSDTNSSHQESKSGTISKVH